MWVALMVKRSHCLVTTALSLIALVGAVPAYGERQTINVLVDAAYAEIGKQFLDGIHGRLARDTVLFEKRVIASPQIRSALNGGGWEMAIVSTTALTDSKTQSVTAAFDLPFVFTTMQSALALQQTPVGRAGLGVMATQGISGLVYLNAGRTLIAGRRLPTSPKYLEGSKVAVYSSTQIQTLQTLGSTPPASGASRYARSP